MRISRTTTRMWALLLGLGLLAPAGTTTAAETGSVAPTGAVELLPDMRMANLYGMRLAKSPRGRDRLRFGTIGWNIGDGPLEVRGAKTDPDDPTMQVKQRIYRSDGTFRTRTTPSIMFYAGDGHEHWHVRSFITVKLYKRGQPTGNVLGLRKLGFCLLDARQMPDPPPRSPASAVYRHCGHAGDVRVNTGISVGYGDDYPPAWTLQWIDVTGLAPGGYRLCTTVDPHDDFVEKSEQNNQRWTDVRIDIPAGRVRVLATGVGSCRPD
jgi:hypothetical protein